MREVITQNVLMGHLNVKDKTFLCKIFKFLDFIISSSGSQTVHNCDSIFQLKLNNIRMFRKSLINLFN